MMGNQSLDLLAFLPAGQEGSSYPIVVLLLSSAATAVSILGRSHLTLTGKYRLNHCMCLTRLVSVLSCLYRFSGYNAEFEYKIHLLYCKIVNGTPSEGTLESTLHGS